MTSALDHILALTDAKPTGADKYFGHGPCHGSQRHRDLSIRVTPDRILLHCFAGCELKNILSALGLTVKDLFVDAPLPQGPRPIRSVPRVDPIARAFQFELGALDRRLRAERILEATHQLDALALTDAVRDRLMTVVMSAYRDLERADLFERVSDTLRWRAWCSREGSRHAA